MPQCNIGVLLIHNTLVGIIATFYLVCCKYLFPGYFRLTLIRLTRGMQTINSVLRQVHIGKMNSGHGKNRHRFCPICLPCIHISVACVMPWLLFVISILALCFLSSPFFLPLLTEKNLFCVGRVGWQAAALNLYVGIIRCWHCVFICKKDQTFNILIIGFGQAVIPVTEWYVISGFHREVGSPIGCPETSLRNYYNSLRNNPEERSSHAVGWVCSYHEKTRMLLFW